MKLSVVTLAGQLFTLALAGALHNSPVHDLHRRTTLEQHLRRDAYDVVEGIERRQMAAGAMSDMTMSAKEEALAQWNFTTAAACSDKLTALGGRASNPAGMAACINTPIVDMATGSFEMEIRMYMIATAVDEWTNIQPADMTVAVTFPNAIRVESSRQTILKRAASMLSWPQVKSDVEKRQTPQLDPVSIQAYLGQINPDKIKMGMSREEFRSLVLPVIILSSRSQPSVTANISTADAAFLSGPLSDKDTVTIPGSSVATVAFVLPGVTLGIFPTGLIITSFWAIAFITVVGLGTVGRIQFREQYRQRVKREMTSGFKTI